MSVKLKEGTEQAVTEELTQTMQRLHSRIIRQLAIAGEKAVEKARLIVTNEGGGGSAFPPYTVQTGNLVSSVGYAVVSDGKIVKQSSFNAVSGPEGDGQDGASAGRTKVKELAMHYPQGYALILVAGMHYASYVQELHHRDVLISGTLVAEQLLAELRAKLDNER